ncbi:lysophosphatidic acid receptor 3-like [Uloborus diversus]|uniref:lysophosphatidic acid receptor 3-like n=1 Tax=Uloborus diversus TaxID=327109 RepID=UPI002408F977|nr:lysophosphatidic acid receptor 3-like [Uloborus diversus]
MVYVFTSYLEIISNNCTLSSAISYDVDKVYVVLAVSTATLSFFLNLTQFIIIIHQRLLKRNKNIIIINLCVCGQLSSLTVIWYIYKVIVFWQEERIVDNYLLCFLLPSGLHLLTLFTFTPLITLLILQHHLVARPKTNRRFSNSHMVVALLVILAWCQAVIISLIPLTGWNNWYNVCSLPMAWSPSFSVLICIIYFLHYPMVIILLTDLCLWSSKRRNSISPEPLCEKAVGDNFCSAVHVEPKPLSNKNVTLLFLLYMAGTLPFMFYTAKVALDQNVDLCESLIANEKAAMWTSWITVVFAAVRPLFHIFVEDDLGDGTATFISVVCRLKHNYI